MFFRQNRFNSGKIFLAIICLGFILAGLLSLLGVAYLAWDDIEVQFFRKNDCMIKYADIRKIDGEYKIAVEYSYNYQGKDYISQKFSNNDRIKRFSDAQRIIDELNSDKKHFCYLKEDLPQRSVLKKEFPWLIALGIFPVIFLFTGFAGFFNSFGKNNKTVSRSKGDKKKNFLVYALFFIFLSVGALFLYFVFYNPFMEYINADKLIESPCRIISSEIRESHSDDSVTYQVNIIYEYDYKGKKYLSNRYEFFSVSDGNYSAKREIVNKYREGHDYICFVNPLDPYRSVLKRGFSNGFYFAGIPLIFVIIGGSGIFLFFINGLRNDIKIKRHRKEFNYDKRDDYSCINHDYEDEIILENEFSPFLKICFISVFSLFWNGIISIFILEVVNSFKSGNPEWFLAVFMIPFVIVGVGTIFGIIYFILSAFNPRPVISVSSRKIFQGDELNIKWHFKGDVNSLERFRIFIEGIESARYRRGTSTYTDTSVFKTIDVIDTKFHGEMIEGSRFIQLPENIMPSFSGGNNNIIWKIKISGEIPKWPDIDNNYIIEIRCKNGQV